MYPDLDGFNMWLLIDDQRDLNCQVIARDPIAAKAVLPACEWKVICYDHDLGTEESGYDVLKWAIENDYMAPQIQLVTSNPVGRENMAQLLKANGYHSVDGVRFFKD